MKKTEDKKYVTTKSVKDMLKISDCSVMHLRTSGKLKFIKKGNSYLYFTDDVVKLLDVNPDNSGSTKNN